MQMFTFDGKCLFGFLFDIILIWWSIHIQILNTNFILYLFVKVNRSNKHICIDKINDTIYNYCLRMRWTSKVVNPRMIFPPKTLARRKPTFRGLTTWCSHHMKAITVLSSETTVRCSWLALFCRRQQKNSGIENIIKKPE